MRGTVDQLRRFIQEIHRRSLWQVLAIYAGASWAVFAGVQTLTEGLGLPGWFPALALILLLIGLPVVLATAFVQEGLSATRRQDPTLMPAAETGSADRPDERARVRRLFTWRNAIAGGVVALALWGVVATGWYLLYGGAEIGTEAARAGFPDGDAPSIAVLPLQNMVGADPEQEYFVVGLTDVLISELSKIRGLVVKSHSSVIRYRDDRPPSPEIGREVGAEYLIEGSVMRGGDEVRITIQLIDASEDRHVWAENYRRPLTDVLKLQEEVVRAIASEIQIQLQPDVRTRLSSAESIDPAALDAYIRGRYHLGRYTQRPERGLELLRSAVSYLRQAIDLEPDWAPPRGELALVYDWLATSGAGRQYFDSADATARSALELDPDLATAHRALMFPLLYRDWDWAGAEAGIRRAVQLDPNGSKASHALAIYLYAAGSYQEAVASYRHAVEVDPFSVVSKAQLGNAYVCAEQPERAIDYLQGVTRLYPDHPQSRAALGAAYLRRGEYDRAIAEYERAAAEQPGFRQNLGYAYAVSGEIERAREIREELDREGERYFPALQVALGDSEAALEQLERAFQARDATLLWLRCVPFLGVDLTRAAGLRDDPRFQPLLEGIDFPE